MAKAANENKKSAVQMLNLHKWNMRLAVIYGLQGVFVLLLSATKLFPVDISYIAQDPIATEMSGHSVITTATRHVFDINLAYVVAGIFLVAALAHLAAATICRKRYETELKKGLNTIRWVEYAVGTGLLSVAIALLAGMHDLLVLGLFFAVAVAMVMVRLTIDIHRSRSKGESDQLLSGISCVGGAMLPIAILVQFWVSGVYGLGVPTFVYVLFGSTLVLAGGFFVNLLLAQRQTGRWADRLYAERVFMALSLVAKTVLVWQIFAGALWV